MSLSEAEIWELKKYVVPKIRAEWKDLAYCIRYSIADVDAINKEKSLEECCEKLFTNWLATDHGPEPKTYETLLKHIKKIDKLFAASKQIEQDLIKGKGKLGSCVR